MNSGGSAARTVSSADESSAVSNEPNREETRMQPPNETTPSGSDRVRIVAGFISLAMGGIYTLQFASAFDRDPYLGGVFIAIACLHIIYSIVLLTQPWTIDSIGRIRPHSVTHAQRWFRAGVGGNLALIVVLSASLSGVLPPLSTGGLELLAVVVGLILIALLMALVRLFR